MSYHIAITITDLTTGQSHLTDIPEVDCYELSGLTTRSLTLRAFLAFRPILNPDEEWTPGDGPEKSLAERVAERIDHARLYSACLLQDPDDVIATVLAALEELR